MMMHMQKLPVRPIPIADESPAGYLVRACEGNGFPSVVTMADGLCEPSYGEGWVLASLTRIERYEELLSTYGLATPEAIALCYQRVGPTSDSPRAFEGGAVEERFFSDECGTFCPACLAQRRYFRKRWSLTPYAVCLGHGIYMQRDCYACHKPLSPLRGFLCQCECGASLLDAPQIPADAGPVEWWLRQALEGGRSAKEAQACLAALIAIGPAISQPVDMAARLRGAQQWLEDGEVSREVRDLIGAMRWHPRISVLPLLESSVRTVHEFGHAILRGIGAWTASDDTDDAPHLNRRQMELVLGVSSFQMGKMHEQHVLEKLSLIEPDGSFRRLAAHRLLCRLTAKLPGSGAAPRALTRSIGSMILSIVEGKEASAGFSMEDGLRSLRSISLPKAHTDVPAEAEEEIDVHEAARIMSTYPEAIRFLAKAGWIEHRVRDRHGRKRLVADRAVVERIATKYVLAGEVAARAKSGVTSTSERLMALGVRAVSGPKIDGALVYMFERDAVAAVDLSKLKELKDYPTSTGRKRTEKLEKSASSEMSLAAAASLLGLTAQTAKRLVVSGHLQEIPNQARQVYVTRRSVLRLKGKLDDSDLVPVEDAAAGLGLKSKAFEVTYVQSGIVHVHDLGVSRRVHCSDIERVRGVREQYLTADEAGRLLKLHRSHLPNLERRGEIKSIQFGNARTIRFYAVTDVQNLIVMGAPRTRESPSLETDTPGRMPQALGSLHGDTYETE